MGLAIRMNWVSIMFSRYDYDESGYITLAKIREMQPMAGTVDTSAFPISIEFIIAEHGVDAKLPKDVFIRMVLQGQILCRELESSQITQFMEDVKQYFNSMRLENGLLAEGALSARLIKREQYTQAEAQLVTGAIFTKMSKTIDLNAFASAVMRQILVIPLSKTIEESMTIDEYFGGDDTQNTTTSVIQTTSDTRVKNIVVSDTVRVNKPFDPATTRTYDVTVRSNVHEVTITVDYELPLKAQVNGWDVSPGVPSRLLHVAPNAPTAEYVKVFGNDGAAQTYTVIIHNDHSASSNIRCTTDRGGSGVPNRMCAFPFEYPAGSGKFHDTCIHDDELEVDWCSTTTRYVGEWGECKPISANCPTLNYNSTDPKEDSGKDSVSGADKTVQKMNILKEDISAFLKLGGSEDGSLTTDALTVALEKWGDKDEDAELLADVVDVNGDHKLTFREIIRAFRLGLIPTRSETSDTSLRIILQMDKEFQHSGKQGVPIHKLAKILAAKFQVSEGMSNLIAREFDSSNDEQIDRLELLRGAHRGLLPFGNTVFEQTYKVAAEAYKRFSLASDDKTATDVTGPLTPSQLQDSFSRIGLPSENAAYLVSVVQSDSSTHQVLFSNFVRLSYVNLAPFVSADVSRVVALLERLHGLFQKSFGDEKVVERDEIEQSLKLQGWEPQESKILANSMTDFAKFRLDFVGFVRLFEDGLVLLPED
eukprot:c9670_g1_i1.p1 GENE.c9670_g1_i1~~c9670_g1_i1.p1  ORF type:complete len:706 (+),score=215.73 c9670_g1_i1:1-2118(+)